MTGKAGDICAWSWLRDQVYFVSSQKLSLGVVRGGHGTGEKTEPVSLPVRDGVAEGRQRSARVQVFSGLEN